MAAVIVVPGYKPVNLLWVVQERNNYCVKRSSLDGKSTGDVDARVPGLSIRTKEWGCPWIDEKLLWFGCVMSLMSDACEAKKYPTVNAMWEANKRWVETLGWSEQGRRNRIGRRWGGDGHLLL